MEEPLQLIQFSNETSSSSAGGTDDVPSIQLNYATLDRVLNRTENRPLCVICVGGPSRQGKSFLLGYMIRCLEALENDEADWMDWENKDKVLSGFKFRNGTKPETQGIWMWSKPFLIKVGSEETPIAVLLVDTQGTYDEFISARTTASIVGISLLMSSCMVFNFFKNLQEDVLTSFESYVNYGKLALQNQQGSTSMKPFQKLTFLIRDWNNPAEFPYGAKGGKGFLDQKLEIKENQSPEARSVRETIKACFETLDCFLMPYPGDTAILPEFKGSIKELNVAFAKKLEEFISNLINPDDLGDTSIKTILGNTVTASEFKSYLESYLSIFNSKDIPSPISLLDATISVTNQSILHKSLRKYEDMIKSHLRTKKFLSNDAINKADKLARKQGASLFKSSKKFGSAEQVQELEEELERLIGKKWKEVKKANQERRSKFLSAEMESSIKTFREDLEIEFSFASENPLEYFEEAKITKRAKSIINDVLDDFQEKISDDLDGSNEDSSLASLLIELENKLKEYLNNQVILENRNRQKEAQKGVEKLIQEIVKEYTDNVSKFSAENPYLDVTSQDFTSNFQEPHYQMRDALISRFTRERGAFAAKGKKDPDFPGCRDSDLTDLLELTFTRLCTAHTVQLQQYQIAADTIMEEVAKMYSNDMESAFPTDEKDLEEWHDNNVGNYHAMFEEQCKVPKDSSLFKNSMVIFKKKLDGIFGAALFELEQKGKVAQQQLLIAIDKSFNMYHNEMAKLLKDTSYMEVEDFQLLNKKYAEKSRMHFREFPLATVNLQNEGMEILVGKLEKDFATLSIQQQQNNELIICESKNLVADCHGFYQNEMKICMERAKTEEQIKEGHHKANQNAVQRFKDNCPVKDDSFTASYINNLQEENEEAFEEVLELFELKMGEEETIAADAIADCRLQYDGQMEKHLKNEEFIRPDDLKKLHQVISQKCIDDCNKKTPLTQGQRVELLDKLEESYQKWSEENDMKLDCEDIAIGIDLGTTYSCVAVYAGGKIRVIPNNQGKNTTPSYVAFQEDGNVIVGEPAKSRAFEMPEHTVFDTKRILGRKFTDANLQEDMKYWSFTVVDDAGIPKIMVRDKRMHPEQISSKILKELKECAENFLGRPVKKAVITVPAYFTDGQKQATIDAGELAGLEVLMVLTEPVAAAIAYKKQHADTFGHGGGQRNTLIFDLGGGTFDVAVLKSKHAELETLAVDGDDHLGGEDFDRALMHFCAMEFKKQHNVDLYEGKDSMQKQLRDDARRRLKRLQGECERRKIDLTSARRVEVVVDSMYGRNDLRVAITRDKFEELNEALFRKTLDGVERALKSAKMNKGEIHDIVLVGGSTRIPRIQEMLRTYFGGKALDISINPDEAVAYGAAMKAAMMNGAVTRESIDFTKIQDVTPMSIGVEIYGGGFSIIIPKSTKIPVKAKERYRTAHNNQTSVQVTIYQGEDEGVAIRNKHLGDFYMNGIPPRDAEVENIDVEMTINAQGILHVNAVCSSTGGSTGIRVTENKQRMSRAVIQRLLDEATAA